MAVLCQSRHSYDLIACSYSQYHIHIYAIFISQLRTHKVFILGVPRFACILSVPVYSDCLHVLITAKHPWPLESGLRLRKGATTVLLRCQVISSFPGSLPLPSGSRWPVPPYTAEPAAVCQKLAPGEGCCAGRWTFPIWAGPRCRYCTGSWLPLRRSCPWVPTWPGCPTHHTTPLLSRAWPG